MGNGKNYAMKKESPAPDRGARFAARKDASYLLFLTAIGAAVIYAAFFYGEGTTVVKALAAVIIAMLFKIVFFTFYVFQENGLRVTIGIRMPVFDYKKITAVSRATKLITASAVSFSCIRIQTGPSRLSAVYVAPENEEEFLKTLRKKCPSAKFTV